MDSWLGHSAVLLASPVSSLIGGGSAAVQVASSASRSSGPMDGYVDTLLRSDTPVSQQGNANEARGEFSRLFVSSFRNGSELKPAGRDYVSKVVAARTGLSQADADKPSMRLLRRRNRTSMRPARLPRNWRSG
jgi:hypothetical protein